MYSFFLIDELSFTHGQAWSRIGYEIPIADLYDSNWNRFEKNVEFLSEQFCKIENIAYFMKPAQFNESPSKYYNDKNRYLKVKLVKCSSLTGSNLFQ